VKYLGDNINNTDNPNWDVIEVSKVNDKIIMKLLNYLKYDVSEKFFISFESLLKLGNRVPEATIRNIVEELDQSHDFKKELFQFILNFIKENDDVRYMKFLLPLLDDPDDSVRWSVIKFLSKHFKNPIIYSELKNHLNKELNPIIYDNLKEIFE